MIDLLEKLKTEKVDKVLADDDPICIFLGGLPGSGKSKLEAKIRMQYPDKDFVVIDADEYRRYHPDALQLRNLPQDAVFKTSEIANNIEAELISYSINQKKNLILVSTLRATDIIGEIIKTKLKPNGYTIGANILSVPVYESALSAQMRYEEQISSEDEIPRYTSLEFIKDTHQKIIKTIQELVLRDKLFDTIQVYKRGVNSNDFPVVVYDSSLKNQNFRNVLEAFIETESLESKKKITPEKISILKKIYDTGKKRNATKDELENILKLYNYFGSELKKEKEGCDGK